MRAEATVVRHGKLEKAPGVAWDPVTAVVERHVARECIAFLATA